MIESSFLGGLIQMGGTSIQVSSRGMEACYAFGKYVSLRFLSRKGVSVLLSNESNAVLFGCSCDEEVLVGISARKGDIDLNCTSSAAGCLNFSLRRRNFSLGVGSGGLYSSWRLTKSFGVFIAEIESSPTRIMMSVQAKQAQAGVGFRGTSLLCLGGFERKVMGDVLVSLICGFHPSAVFQLSFLWRNIQLAVDLYQKNVGLLFTLSPQPRDG